MRKISYRAPPPANTSHVYRRHTRIWGRLRRMLLTGGHIGPYELIANLAAAGWAVCGWPAATNIARFYDAGVDAHGRPYHGPGVRGRPAECRKQV
jgi:hypothetical protein